MMSSIHKHLPHVCTPTLTDPCSTHMQSWGDRKREREVREERKERMERERKGRERRRRGRRRKRRRKRRKRRMRESPKDTFIMKWYSYSKELESYGYFYYEVI